MANAGFPLLGHMDNLQKIYEICAAHDVWLHLHGHLLAGLCLLDASKVVSIKVLLLILLLLLFNWFYQILFLINCIIFLFCLLILAFYSGWQFVFVLREMDWFAFFAIYCILFSRYLLSFLAGRVKKGEYYTSISKWKIWESFKNKNSFRKLKPLWLK